MATKRDLVEAHSYSRRRLVTAFVSGAPGGREVEPTTATRVLVGGAALAVLLLAGAAIAGIVTTKTPAGWARPGLFVSEETGVTYVITDDDPPIVVRPVVNITSAKLILGGEAKPTIIAQADLDKQVVGGDIGILGAPESPPPPGRLVDTGWTACTGPTTGIRLDVTATPSVRPAAGAGAVVRSGDRFYLLAQSARTDSGTPSAYRYLLPGDPGARDTMLTALGLRAGAYATQVSDTFLGLFPTGGDLAFESFGLRGAGQPATYATRASGLPAGSRVGDLVAYPGGALLLGPDHPVDLDPFGQAVYAHLPAPHTPRTVRASGPVMVERGPANDLAAHWPGRQLEPLIGEQCVQLDVGSGRARVQLAGDPTGDASAADVPAEVVSVRVDLGHGAFVLSGDWVRPASDAGGRPFLLDASGRAHPVVGAGAADLLGYAEVDAPVVPDAWIELLRPGVPLSQAAALCPPGRRQARADSCN